MNARACMDADDVRTCGSRTDEHVANMWDKIWKLLQLQSGYDCSYFNSRPLTHGMIAEQSDCVMTKNESYMITGRWHSYNFLRVLLRKSLTHGQS